MEVGIKNIAAYLPAGRVTRQELEGRFGVDKSFLERKTGSIALARSAEGETTTEMAVSAARKLLAHDPSLKDRVGMLVVVTQNPDGGGLPHLSAKVHSRLGLSRSVAAFDLSLACSGWVYALSVCRAFMEAQGIADGILVTADPYSKILAPGDRDTGLLFGDAATATHLSSRLPEWLVGPSVFGTDGEGSGALMKREDGTLFMNGRKVFEFSATVVPAAINELLGAARLSVEDIDLFLMHQGSRYIVDAIGERLGASDRTPYFAAEIGNTVSSSIPLALSTLKTTELKRIVVAGFGVGLSWAVSILEKSR